VALQTEHCARTSASEHRHVLQMFLSQLETRNRDGTEEFIEVIRSDLVSWWKYRSSRGALVRYENLMCSSEATLREMLDTLALHSPAKVVDSMVQAGNAMTAEVKGDRTSPDGFSSVGRWAKDLDLRLQEICNDAFRDLLDEADLGYGSCGVERVSDAGT
jgi:hypothetical protein